MIYTFRQIFWADRDRYEPKIEMASMDGSQRQVIVNSSMVDEPNHLFLDYANNRYICFLLPSLTLSLLFILLYFIVSVHWRQWFIKTYMYLLLFQTLNKRSLSMSLYLWLFCLSSELSIWKGTLKNRHYKSHPKSQMGKKKKESTQSENPSGQAPRL